MIKKIILEIKGKDVEMTLDELNALKGDLDKLIVKESNYYPVYPTYPTYPDHQRFWYNGIATNDITFTNKVTSTSC